MTGKKIRQRLCRHIACALLIAPAGSGCSRITGRASAGAEPRAVSPDREPGGPARFALCSEGLPTEGMWKCDPILADFNADGLLDLAALPRLGRGPRVWLHGPSRTWRESSAGLAYEKRSCGGGLAAADVNNDGRLDLVVADHCQGVFVYLGDGAGRWTGVARSMHPPAVRPGDTGFEIRLGAEDVAVGDVNGDGFTDIVAAASDEGGLNVYLSDGGGQSWVWTEADLPHEGWANRVALADLNADGTPDLVACMGVGPRVWLGDGNGGWREASEGLPSPMMHGLYHGVSVGDLNEDGRTDLAVANWVDGPEVYFQTSDTSWHKAPDVFSEMRGGAQGLDLGDLDGDGHLDMVVSGRLTLDGGLVRGVFAIYGDGNGGWRFDPASGLPTTGFAGMAGVAVADVDADHLADIAVASGLIVETAPGPTEPIIPQRLLLWCGQR